MTHALLALTLLGCAPGTWAWQAPAEADARDTEAWRAVRAEAEATWGYTGRCAEPDVWLADTLDEVADACGYARADERWGCYRAPSRRHPYVVVWTEHPRPRRLVVWEMTHWVHSCAGVTSWAGRQYVDEAAFRAVVNRAWERIQ